MNFQFLYGDVPRSTSCGVYISQLISQLIRFARVSSHVDVFYGDLVYKSRKIMGKYDFPYHFKKIIVRYKHWL